MKQAEIETVKSLAAPTKLNGSEKDGSRITKTGTRGRSGSNLPESVVTVHTILTGTVIVISSEPPGKDGNVRLTTVPKKALSN